MNLTSRISGVMRNPRRDEVTINPRRKPRRTAACLVPSVTFAPREAA